MRKRKTNQYKIPNQLCRHIYVHNDFKKTLDRLQKFYQKKENNLNPKKPRKVTNAWTSKKLNSIINGMLKGEIK